MANPTDKEKVAIQREAIIDAITELELEIEKGDCDSCTYLDGLERALDIIKSNTML